MKRLLKATLILFIACLPAYAQLPRIELESIGATFSGPVYLTNAKDGSGRRFVLEQAGRIMLAGPPSSVFLDIRSRIVSGGERGLLGLAFHPQFSTNRRFFVNYTRTPDGATVIAEYRASASNANAGDPSSESILLTIPQPFTNHNGGMVEFGPDGLLYIGMGDGGSGNDPQNRAQNPAELLGKMLRMDVDTRRVEIFASGLRNPWRFSFDRASGDLWAGDVGQSSREEIDIIRQGGNYGWRVLEGTRCTGLGPASCTAPGFIPPVTEYITGSGGRCSVTGGYVYRGSRATVPYGAYIFGDYCSGEIFMWKDGIQSVLRDTNLNITSFGEDEAGEIYVVGQGGAISRITNPDVVTSTQRSFALPDRGSVSFTAGEGVVPLTVGYARIQAASGAFPGGLAIYAFRSAGDLVSEATVPISALIQSGRIYAEGGGAVGTGIAIANPNSQAVTITFYFTDANGQDFGHGTTVIPAGQQVARFLNEEPFNATGSFRGAFTFSTSALVSAFALRGFTNERSEFLFTTLPVAPLGGSTGQVHFPQYADGGGWVTEFILINPTDAAIGGTLQSTTPLSLDGQNGSTFPYSIPAKSSRRFVSSGLGSATSVGGVRVTPDANSSAPSGSAIFRYRVGATTVSEGGVPAMPAGTAFRTYAEIAGALQTGLAIVNPSTATALVTLELSPLAGGTAAYTGTVSVPAGEQRALFLREIPGFANVSPPFRGVLRITSAVPVAVASLRGRINERGEFLITATTPADENVQVSSSELLFPQFAVGGAYETQFVLFNGGSAQTQTGTIYFFENGGQAGTLTLR